ncbi:MAG: HNH endonuclease [Eubacterium sp.]|nr:HNH endonuclease [Eubacterium sp.]
MLKDFSDWMTKNSALAESSVYKYTRALNTVSNEMFEQGVINKTLLDMNLVELDIAIMNIFGNEYFIEKNTRGKRMYSNALKQYRYFVLEGKEDDVEEEKIEREISTSNTLSETEKKTLIMARVGQGAYRRKLMRKYNHQCIVTGIDKSKLLIASHIKPWAICRNEERIDSENGLLLCANMDRLFDSGLISFTDEGQMLISSFVGVANVSRLHISEEITVNLRATNRLLSYLEYHRDVLFVK